MSSRRLDMTRDSSLQAYFNKHDHAMNHTESVKEILIADADTTTPRKCKHERPIWVEAEAVYSNVTDLRLMIGEAVIISPRKTMATSYRRYRYVSKSSMRSAWNRVPLSLAPRMNLAA